MPTLITSNTALSPVVGLYFQPLANSTCLAAVLLIPVVSLEAPKLFVATKKLAARWNSRLPEREWPLSRGPGALSRNLKKGGTMKVQRVVLVLMGMMFLFAGKSSAQQVKTDYDRGANFAQYKTYSWEHVKTQDPLVVA